MDTRPYGPAPAVRIVAARPPTSAPQDRNGAAPPPQTRGGVTVHLPRTVDERRLTPRELFGFFTLAAGLLILSALSYVATWDAFVAPVPGFHPPFDFLGKL